MDDHKKNVARGLSATLCRTWAQSPDVARGVALAFRDAVQTAGAVFRPEPPRWTWMEFAGIRRDAATATTGRNGLQVGRQDQADRTQSNEHRATNTQQRRTNPGHWQMARGRGKRVRRNGADVGATGRWYVWTWREHGGRWCVWTWAQDSRPLCRRAIYGRAAYSGENGRVWRGKGPRIDERGPGGLLTTPGDFRFFQGGR
ncbi:MAG: hypothetical protein EOM20_07155 [Spartobacteria bacterium]|nr:hypothetical protein [Spartobacteria bacterium]